MQETAKYARSNNIEKLILSYRPRIHSNNTVYIKGNENY